ncbi:BMP family ABC transporter substrate-binding protein [Desulfovibrio mangrovi]|uniref:BMP family lipoprotein n=1 Tax=Desulfovibrio mangrovi TaxID=2976983 RepID=UPI002244FD6B|nr:BMP family ABC transporter substrate-binding protein [Desulfovibrio mangrovi]UZP67128.1 BMP family ABC transporter substrate-binding protein [Desulfovibrio mangrovi]
MKSRILSAVAVSLLLVLTLFSVGIPANAQTDKPVVGFVTGAGGLGDMSFNDNAYGGLRRAQQELGFSLNVLEADATGTAPADKVEALVEQCDILVLLGAQHTHHAREYAPKHPDKKFIFYEEKVAGIPNLASIMFRQQDGSFLAGALAGRVSRTRKIAFLGGTYVAPVAAFAQGFLEGVKEVAPDVTVDIHYITPPGDFSGFSNPDRAYAMAEEMFANGVDIIFAVAGLSGNGVIEAARRTEGRYVIGVDSDQDDMAAGKVLTSMVKRLDVATYLQVYRAVTGNFKPGVTDFGLADNAVTLTDMRHTRNIITEPVIEEVNALRLKIISGEIVVTDLRP